VCAGFGLNFFNVLRAKGRLILLNGSHRLYALRERGVRYAPCLITDAQTEEQLVLASPEEVRQHQSEFLHAARPSLFKDYFDPVLAVVLPIIRFIRVLRLELTVHEHRVPAQF
jgi:hypothetical protein